MDPLIARTLDNKYLVERLLGKGGMGSVYLAIHTGTKRNVAVKVIAPQFMRNKELLIRFQREAEAAGRLNHPNVVNVTDFGVALLDGTPLAYLVMEYLDGEMLHDYLQKNPLPPPNFVIDVLEQVALGVTEAHSRGILHRDLKPQNIWLQPDGRGGYLVKVLDFGIAKLADPSHLAMELPELEAAPNAEEAASAVDENATQLLEPTSLGLTNVFADSSGFATTMGATLGTPAFMAPEQCSGGAVSDKSDLYSLAMMAYLMLAGELPFRGNARELIEQQIHARPVAPHLRNARLGAAVSGPILQSLSKDPQHRAPSLLAFVARLRTALEGEIQLLKESRSTRTMQSGAWLGVLAASALPAAIILWLARMGLRGMVEADTLAEWAGALLLLLVQFLSAYAALLLADTMMARWIPLQRAGTASLRKFAVVAYDSLRSAPSTVGAAMFTLHPIRHGLAHITAPLEKLGVGLARQRSAALLNGIEAVALALLVRRVAIAWLVVAYYPATMMVLRIPVPIILREYVSGGLGGMMSWLSFSFLPVYSSFITASYFLYLRGRWCLGESPEQRDQRYAAAPGRVGEGIRLGTKVWLAVPVLLVLLMVLPPLVGWNEKFGDTLLAATLEGRLPDVERLLKAGEDPNFLPPRGRLPLQVAVQNGNQAIFDLLLANGAKPDARPNLTGPIHYAIFTGREGMLQQLLERGANINAQDNTGETALSLAVKKRDAQTVRFLLERGAKKSIANEEGQLPLDHARRLGYAEIVTLLEGN